MSAMANASAGLPVSLQRQRIAKKTNHSCRFLPRATDLGRMLISLPSIRWPVIPRTFTLKQGTMERGLFANL